MRTARFKKMKSIRNRSKGRRLSGSTMRIAQRISEGRPRPLTRRQKRDNNKYTEEVTEIWQH